MFENNIFRMIMLLGGVIIVGYVIRFLNEYYAPVKEIFNNFFSYRLQKY